MNGPAKAHSDVLRRFDEGLADEGVELELCVVGGAVLTLAFAGSPTTRRPRALFAAHEASLQARRRAAEKAGVAFDRLEEAARKLVLGSSGECPVFEGERLRVFAPPPDYVMAMKCAALRYAPDGSNEDDIRYLLRFMGLASATEAVERVSDYLSPRQRPADLEARLAPMIR